MENLICIINISLFDTFIVMPIELYTQQLKSTYVLQVYMKLLQRRIICWVDRKSDQILKAWDYTEQFSDQSVYSEWFAYTMKHLGNLVHYQKKIM